MKVGLKTKASFWATRCGYKWNDNRARILNNKILKVEKELENIRDWLVRNYSDFKKIEVKKRNGN